MDYANTPKDKLRGKHRPILNDNLGSGFEAFLYDACVNMLSVTKGACYICMSSSKLHTLHGLEGKTPVRQIRIYTSKGL